MTVERPLKLPISTIMPLAGTHAASNPRKRASFSVRWPGTFRVASHASLRTVSRSAGILTVAKSCLRAFEYRKPFKARADIRSIGVVVCPQRLEYHPEFTGAVFCRTKGKAFSDTATG